MRQLGALMVVVGLATFGCSGTDAQTGGTDEMQSGECIASCAARQCGPDGCGGSCGTCKLTESCNPAGLCLANSTDVIGDDTPVDPGNEEAAPEGLPDVPADVDDVMESTPDTPPTDFLDVAPDVAEPTPEPAVEPQPEVAEPAPEVPEPGADVPDTCVPSWSCGGWTACACDDTQTRTCTDANACGTEAGKPAGSQSCDHCGDGTCDCGETGATCSADCPCVANHHKACCDSAVCWFDSCGNKGTQVAACPSGCNGAKCLSCQSQCDHKLCGDDGCGGDCGYCAAGQTCGDLSPVTAPVSSSLPLAVCTCSGAGDCPPSTPCDATADFCALPMLGSTFCPTGTLPAGMPAMACMDIWALLSGI